MNRVLVVDDSLLNCELLKTILEKEYDVILASNGLEAIEKLHTEEDIGVILLDLHMPEMNGFEMLNVLTREQYINQIPVLIITGEKSTEIEKRCFELGVSDFIRKPFEPMIVLNRVRNISDLFAYRRSLEKKIDEQTETMQIQYQLLKKQAAELEETNTRVIDILGTVVEYRNMESGEHIKRVKGFTRILALQVMRDYPEYNLTEDKIDLIVAASSLHDIGKIAISDTILLKPGKLTEEEYELMKEHTTKGCEILDSIEDIWGSETHKYGYDICHYHHERYDGNGYPEGLKGEDIPISAQIVSVADVYDALASDRVYKKAFPKDQVFQMITTGECGVFSPKLMACLTKVRSEFEALADSHKDK